VVPVSWLTGNHTIFVEVIEGQDVVEKISEVDRDRTDKPRKPVVIERVEIEQVA